MTSRIIFNLTAFFILINCLTITSANEPEECEYWAEVGECEKNPGYMLNNCAKACAKVDNSMNEDIGDIGSFFDLSANDIDGNEVNFDVFRGMVTIVVNVASYCGYTESHYRELVALHEDLKKTEMVEIVAFPCNQFGQQEPEPCPAIKKFAERKGVQFRMMDKIDVNGPTTHRVYKFLKKMAGPSRIEWNFATYFVISPDGYVQSFNGVLPSQLKDVAVNLLQMEL
eukprot:CAMPEP_0172504340 /NCGR_PEP_ID=MMETSP1066-20121228/177772_1 /TAXON_ID=671091 /ORGANISM="Coscinodiscus wailesii, Strain CCMP2513" /LENGTH=226 /DNA_ID=CAMNT_0013280493 /DNA_START=44 /DNA_END=724 /DNA_ORIENTATION=+